MRRTWITFALVLGLLAPLTALAATSPDEMLEDPQLEQRARELGKQLRCVVCQNQSIDDSDAPLARDLRGLVRERLSEGDTNTEVLDYVTARYGDFVLLEPPVRGSTLVLWYGPFALLLLGGVGAALWVRRQRRAPEVVQPLSDDERADLARLLEEKP